MKRVENVKAGRRKREKDKFASFEEWMRGVGGSGGVGGRGRGWKVEKNPRGGG